MSTAETRLTLYLDAEEKILRGQEVRMDGRLLRRADLQRVQEEISKLQSQVNADRRRAAGVFGPSMSRADFSGRCR